MIVDNNHSKHSIHSTDFTHSALVLPELVVDEIIALMQKIARESFERMEAMFRRDNQQLDLKLKTSPYTSTELQRLKLLS